MARAEKPSWLGWRGLGSRATLGAWLCGLPLRLVVGVARAGGWGQGGIAGVLGN